MRRQSDMRKDCMEKCYETSLKRYPLGEEEKNAKKMISLSLCV